MEVEVEVEVAPLPVKSKQNRECATRKLAKSD